jgi:hypothetical protein
LEVSLLPRQQQIQNEASPGVVPLASAVIENICGGTTGVFQGIGQNAHLVEGTFLVNCLRQPRNGGIMPGE